MYHKLFVFSPHSYKLSSLGFGTPCKSSSVVIELVRFPFQ
uniref:Uncharacterized protein n=1 Tax=Anguilla anguilla TaxID=7936 RepID=A0A0E9WKP6_ANGAN